MGKNLKTEDWAQMINMGLYMYEQDLHTSQEALNTLGEVSPCLCLLCCRSVCVCVCLCVV